jgi:hypothetical protein
MHNKVWHLPPTCTGRPVRSEVRHGPTNACANNPPQGQTHPHTFSRAVSAHRDRRAVAAGTSTLGTEAVRHIARARGGGTGSGSSHTTRCINRR